MMPGAIANPFETRRGGILLHITSLPGPYDSGVVGADARTFVDFLQSAGLSVWQTLPLGPVESSTLSPYTVRSANAGNPRLIDFDLPETVAWRLTPTELEDAEEWGTRRWLLDRLWQRFCRLHTVDERTDLTSFVRRERRWLVPFSLFEAIRESEDERPWWEWPEPLRTMEPGAIRRAHSRYRLRMHRIMFEQYLIDWQWQDLKQYANSRGVCLFGDLPVYVDLDSVEVWSMREMFQVDALGHARVVSGVPPDYFSEDGQLWGHPIYDWGRMAQDGFRWWVDRLRRQLRRFDFLRIDHFRALESYWEVPGDATTARTGRWAPGPGVRLLDALAGNGLLDRLVAEDLGVITPEVRALRDRYGLPGMLVLQFAFDGSADNPFLPSHHSERAVVYTGTHDNDTTLGWYTSLAPETRAHVDQLVEDGDSLPWSLIGAAAHSRARLAVFPMQDFLELGSSSRMNTPGTTKGNWAWRFQWDDLPRDLANRIRRLLVETGRIVGPE